MKKTVLKHRFSLIELLVVCGILMVLMGMGIGVYSLVNRKMSDSRCKAMIAKMCIALENYKSKTGYYIQTEGAVTGFYIDKYKDKTSPAGECSLNDFIDIPDSEILDAGVHRKTLSPAISNLTGSAWKDPWGNQFQYRCPGTHNPMSFDLYSSGSDTTITEDDISNWKQ